MTIIGYIAIVFSVICGAIYIVESNYPQDKPVAKIDYNRLYKNIVPEEIQMGNLF